MKSKLKVGDIVRFRTIEEMQEIQKELPEDHILKEQRFFKTNIDHQVKTFKITIIEDDGDDEIFVGIDPDLDGNPNTDQATLYMHRFIKLNRIQLPENVFKI